MYKFEDATLSFIVARIINNAYLVQSYKDKLKEDNDSTYLKKQIEKHEAILKKQCYTLEKYIKSKNSA